MSGVSDGARSAKFWPLVFDGNVTWDALAERGISEEMAQVVTDAPRGERVGWGIPFMVQDAVLVSDQPG